MKKQCIFFCRKMSAKSILILEENYEVLQQCMNDLFISQILNKILFKIKLRFIVIFHGTSFTFLYTLQN